MTWRDIFRLGNGAPDDAVLLRQAVEIAGAGKVWRLVRMCRRNAAFIEDRFPSWIARARSESPVERARDLAGLNAIATCFAERLDRPELAALLADGASPEATQPWTMALVRGERLAARGDHEVASRVLREEVERLRAACLDRDRLLATTLAHLARAEAARGREREAVAAMTEALELWRRTGDAPGVLSALESLVVLERRLSEDEAAARHARALAAELESAGELERARQFGALARSLSGAARGRARG